jgi:predicted ABC-type ATPase
MLRRLDELAESKVSFAFETTLATRSFAPRLRELQKCSYEVVVIYVWLPSADLSVQRVSRRVRAGGHHVPEEVIRRRYHRGVENFLQLYAPDAWRLYDNSSDFPLLVAHGGRGVETNILSSATWQRVTQRSP